MVRMADFFGVSVKGMYEVVGIAFYAVGIAFFVGMVWGDGVWWPFVVLAFASFVMGVRTLGRVGY